MAKEKHRLDELLVELGYFEDVRAALGPIMAGDVRVKGQPATKPGVRVGVDEDVSVRGLELAYASRGGIKLERALEAFDIDVTGLTVLDAGASTGGFTDCLLQHGAARVIAVDAGYGQLRGKLASDDRVVVMEKTNISDLPDGDAMPCPVDICTVDLSYLSLVKAVPELSRVAPGARMICLIKPLYEGVGEEARGDRRAILMVASSLLQKLAAEGHFASSLIVSPILGGRGAVELLACITDVENVPIPVLVEQLEEYWEKHPPS